MQLFSDNKTKEINITSSSSFDNKYVNTNLSHVSFEGNTFTPSKWLNEFVTNKNYEKEYQNIQKYTNNKDEVNETNNSKQMEDILQETNDALQRFTSVLSDRIDINFMRLSSSLSIISTDLPKLEENAMQCKENVEHLQNDISNLHSSQWDILKLLGGIDKLKQKMGATRKILSDLHQWELRLSEIESLLNWNSDADIHGSSFNTSANSSNAFIGNLSQAMEHIVELQETSDMLAAFPEFSNKRELIPIHQKRILKEIQRGLKYSITMNLNWQPWIDLYIKMNLNDELILILQNTFYDICNTLWVAAWKQMQQLEDVQIQHGDGTDVASVEEVLFTFCESFSIELEQRASMLAYTIESIASNKSTNLQINTSSKHSIEIQLWDSILYKLITETLWITRNDMEYLISKIDATYDNINVLQKILCGYETMTNLIFATPVIAERDHHGGNVWTHICETAEFIPILLFEKIILSQHQSDTSIVVAHPIKPSNSFSKMAFDAEAAISTVLNKLLDSGIIFEGFSTAFIAPAWYSLCDNLLSNYLKELLTIIAVFRGEISKVSQSPSTRGGRLLIAESINIEMDAKHFGNCIQLHNIIVGLYPKIEKVASTLCSRGSKAYMRANRFNLFQRNLSKRHTSLSVCTNDAIENAINSFKEFDDTHSISCEQCFNLTVAVWMELKQSSIALVVQCCVDPVKEALKHYSYLSVWSAEASSEPYGTTSRSPSPTIHITSVGGHFLSLATFSDQHSEEQGGSIFWLSLTVDAITEYLIEVMLKIPKMTSNGATQLLSDINYIIKVSETLTGSCEHLNVLKAALQTVVSPADVSKYIQTKESTSFELYRHSFAKMIANNS